MAAIISARKPNHNFKLQVLVIALYSILAVPNGQLDEKTWHLVPSPSVLTKNAAHVSQHVVLQHGSFFKARIGYYPNSMASYSLRRVILSGDVETNPGMNQSFSHTTGCTTIKVSDKNSHIFKHFSQFPSCKGMYTPSCFRILDSANSSIDLKLKEAFYISKNKPDLNKQLHHFNTFLTL